MNITLSYADSQTLMNRGQEGSLLKLHTAEGYWVIEDESILQKLSEGITVMYSKKFDYIRVRALKSGSTNVRFYSNKGNLLGIESVKVITPIDNFTLSESQLFMCVNDKKSLNVKINPIDADHQDVYWESSDTSIAEVDNNGNITAKKVGKVTITAKSSDNENSATCLVEVIIPTSSIEVDDADISITSRLDKTKIKTKVYPENATNTNLIFESNNTNVVKVNEQGYVEAVNNGTAIITIKSEDGFSTATKKVTVEGLVEEINLNETSIELNDVGETFVAKATINPDNALDKTIKWASSDEKIATIDQNGVIKANGVGECIITATSNDGKISNTITVKVNPLIELSFHEITKYGQGYHSSSKILADKYVKKNSKVLLETPKKHGYTFEGWYRDFSNGEYLNPIKNNEINAEFDQTLYAKFTPIKVTSISLTKEYITSDGVDEFLNIEGCFNPGYVANGKYTINSSNSKVAEVINKGSFSSFGEDNKNIITGTLKIKGYGTTTITVTTEDGKKTATKKITIGKDDITGERIVIKDIVPEFSLSMASNNCIKIDFPYYEDASYYEFIASDSLGNEWNVIINNPKQGSYIDTNAKNYNTTYSYKMKVYYGGRVRTNYSPISKFKILLSKPNLKAKSNNYNSVKLSINKVANAKEYRIYRSTDNKNWSYLNKTTSLSYTDTGLTTGKMYYYKIRAYNGNIKSNYSNVVSIKPNLKTPSSKASSESYNSNKISWSKVSGANGYIIYRSTSKDGKYSSVKTITKSSITSYTDSSLPIGKAYYYKVRAYKVVNKKKVYSRYSSVVNSKPTLKTPSIKLTATSKKATVKWSRVSGASGYEIYRATSKNGSYSKVKTITKGSTLSHTDSKLRSKKTYYYKIRAYRTVSGKKVYSSYSSVKSIKVK